MTKKCSTVGENWPTKQAFEAFPEIAERLEKADKVVFSRSSFGPTWTNSKLAETDLIAEVKALKASSGDGMTVLGSGSLVQQLSKHNLIDEYQVLVDPIVLEGGTSLFEGLDHRLSLKLLESRAFKSGAMFLHYQQQKGSK